MIITPNTVIDNDHMNSFQEEFQTYNKTPGEETVHRGTGDLKNCDVVVKPIRTLQGNGIYLAVHNGDEGIFICRLISAPVPQGVLPWGRKRDGQDFGSSRLCRSRTGSCGIRLVGRQRIHGYV
jgi:hypothetical protein